MDVRALSLLLAAFLALAWPAHLLGGDCDHQEAVCAVCHTFDGAPEGSGAPIVAEAPGLEPESVAAQTGPVCPSPCVAAVLPRAPPTA